MYLVQTLQSVICRPAHNECVPLPTEDDAANSTKHYAVQGFAYNGCGTAINRVELTFDGGKTWKYCIKKYLKNPLRCVFLEWLSFSDVSSYYSYGEKHWAWIFWYAFVSIVMRH